MLLIKGDQIRLHDSSIVEVIDVWGVARSHAKIRDQSGAVSLIIAERDVESVLRRPAIRKKKVFE